MKVKIGQREWLVVANRHSHKSTHYNFSPAWRCVHKSAAANQMQDWIQHIIMVIPPGAHSTVFSKLLGLDVTTLSKNDCKVCGEGDGPVAANFAIVL